MQISSWLLVTQIYDLSSAHKHSLYDFRTCKLASCSRKKIHKLLQAVHYRCHFNWINLAFQKVFFLYMSLERDGILRHGRCLENTRSRKGVCFMVWTSLLVHVYQIIMQKIVTLSKDGHDALDICHP